MYFRSCQNDCFYVPIDLHLTSSVNIVRIERVNSFVNLNTDVLAICTYLSYTISVPIAERVWIMLTFTFENRAHVYSKFVGKH